MNLRMDMETRKRIPEGMFQSLRELHIQKQYVTKLISKKRAEIRKYLKDQDQVAIGQLLKKS